MTRIPHVAVGLIAAAMALGAQGFAQAHGAHPVGPHTPPGDSAAPGRDGSPPGGPPDKVTVARWSWLRDTYWYVPTSNLPAFVFDADQEVLMPVADQTVFHIADYRDGYFWGRTVVQLQGATKSSLTCLSLVGAVTPEGQVLLTFTPTDPPQTAVTQGIGQMTFRMGQWKIEPQMSTGPERFQVIHWAYMTQSQPDQPSWQSLPGVGVSIPEFLAQCPGEPHLAAP